jgi:hypothetical protein
LPVDVPVRGVRRLELFVDCPQWNRGAWSVWLEPRLSASAGDGGSDTASEPAALAEAPAGPIDLLKLVDVTKDSARGQWKREGDTILPPTQAFVRLKLPCIPPKEYDLDLQVTSSDPELDVLVGLQSSGRPFSAVLEGFNEFGGDSTSGLENIAGRRANANETSKKGRFSKAGERAKVHIEVREAQILVNINDQEVINWRGDQRMLGAAPFAMVDDLRVLYLGSHGRRLTFHSAVLTPVTGKAQLLRGAAVAVVEPAATPDGGADDKEAAPPKLEHRWAIDVDALIRGKPSIDLLEAIDPEIDAVRGEFSKRDGELIMPAAEGSGSLLQIPYTGCEEYALVIDLTRVDGHLDFNLNLPIDNWGRTVVLDRGTSKKFSTFYIFHEGMSGEKWVETTTFKKGERSQLVCVVEKQRTFVGCNGNTIFLAEGKRTGGGNTDFRPPIISALAVGTIASPFVIHSMKLIPLRGEPVALRPADADLAKVKRPPMGEVFLDELQEIQSVLGRGTLGKRGATGYPPLNAQGQALPSEVMVQGKKPAHALSMHPPFQRSAQVAYRLDGKYRTLSAKAALMDAKDSLQIRAPVAFQIIGDGKSLWRTEDVKRNGDSLGVSVDVTGVERLDLVVEAAGLDEGAWAVWLEPKLLP